MALLLSRHAVARLAAFAFAATLFMTGFGSTAHGQGTGPEVGAKVPSFQGTDHLGKDRNFDDLSGDNGLLLLFFRSADW